MNYLFMVPAGKRLTALIIRLSSSLDQGLEDFVFSPAEVPLREKERFFYFIVQLKHYIFNSCDFSGDFPFLIWNYFLPW